LSNISDDDGTFVPGDDDGPLVSESPGAADVDIYETAYRDEIERIMARAKEEQKEPNVYLTRRVDERLMAISGLAGRWAARGEEARNQIRDYTQFSTRRARVTEVSRALRHAAKEEYERRRQEHREWIAAEKAEKARAKEDEASKSITPGSPPPPGAGSEVEDAAMGSPQSPSKMWKGKAVDAGRQARTSLMGFMDMVKSKSRTRSKDEEAS
jgi:[calcium/calmodulin-dependent protein kinase] kinase